MAADGRLTVPARGAAAPGARLLRSIRLGPLPETLFRIPARSGRCRAIQVQADSIFTDELILRPRVQDGAVVADPAQGTVKLAVLERHRASGRVGLGLLAGLGLRAGALAASVSHDAHNIVVAGADDRDMLAAVREIQRMQGGLVAVREGRTLARLPLPVAGLVTEEPLLRVVGRMDALGGAARELGVRLPYPFLTLSFVTLAVIPHLKLTDRGLVDVDGGRIVPLWMDASGEFTKRLANSPE